jgi:hypothetical protein
MIRLCKVCNKEQRPENSYQSKNGKFKNRLCNNCIADYYRLRNKHETEVPFNRRLCQYAELFQPEDTELRSNGIIDGILCNHDGSIVFSVFNSGATNSKAGTIPQRVSLKGYWVFDFCYSQIKTHRIVCDAFNGSAPIDNPIVNHIDFNKLNNHYSNLEWCDYQYNNYHARQRNK